MKEKIVCPHCGVELNIGSLLGKVSARKRKLSSEHMRDLALKRHRKDKDEPADDISYVPE